MKKYLVLVVLAVVAVVGCRLDGTSDDPDVQKYGSLILSLSTSDMTRSAITPPQDMDIAYYNVRGDGPDEQSFTQSGVTGSSVIQESLLRGPWAVTVDAYNATDEWIGTGSVTVAIAAGEITHEQVVVTPLEGTGVLEISLSWPSGGVENPEVTGTLERVDGTEQAVPFVVGTDSASYTYGSLDVGYYSLTITLTGTHTNHGLFVSVRVLKDQTTQAMFEFTADEVNAPGELEITVVPRMDDPIGITFSGQLSPIAPGEGMTVTATTTSDPVDSYQWYLNGVALTGETAGSITIGSDLAEGVYRLDLRVIKGNVIASQSHSFVVGVAPEPVEISGAVDGGVYDASVTPTWTTQSGTRDEAVLVSDSTPVEGYQKGDVIPVGAPSTFPTEAKISTLTVTSTNVLTGLTAESRVQFLQLSSSPSQHVQTNTVETGAALDVYFLGGPEVNVDFRTPLYVFWVEALDGTLLHNLFVTNVPGTNRMRYNPQGAWRAKPSSVPYWAHKATVLDPYMADSDRDTEGLYLALPTMDGGPIPEDLDAVTGVTPLGDPVGTEEDFIIQSARRADGISVFRVLLEVNKGRNDNEYHDYDQGTDYYAWDSGQPSLVYAAEVDIATENRFYVMSLIGAGHHSGADGNLHDTSNHTTALDMVETVIVHVK